MARKYAEFNPSSGAMQLIGGLQRGFESLGQAGANLATIGSNYNTGMLAKQKQKELESQNVISNFHNDRLYELNKQKTDIEQAKHDQGVADSNDTFSAYAKLGATQMPEFAKSYGYGNNPTNTMDDVRFGKAVKAKMEIDKAGLDGFSTDEKMFSRIYGYGTPEYKRAVNNLATKKQMITTQDENGNYIYTMPTAGGSVLTPAITNANDPTEQKPSVQTVIGIKQQQSPLETQIKEAELQSKINKNEQDNIELQDQIVGFKTNIDSANNAINLIDGLTANKSLSTSTGMWNYLPSVQGTDRYAIDRQVETLKSKGFLSSIEAMKGSGSLSDAEGKQLSAAIANLDLGQPYEEVIKQLGVIRDFFDLAAQRSREKLKARGATYETNSTEDEDIAFVKSKMGIK